MNVQEQTEYFDSIIGSLSEIDNLIGAFNNFFYEFCNFSEIRLDQFQDFSQQLNAFFDSNCDAKSCLDRILISGVFMEILLRYFREEIKKSLN